MIEQVQKVTRQMRGVRAYLSLARNLRGGLYYFFCHRASGLVPCKFRWWRRDCLSCLIRASRQLADWRQRW